MDITVSGTFEKGLKIGTEDHRSFQLRPASTRDMVAAENDVPVSKGFAYRLALAARQLVSIGSLVAPISYDRVLDLDPADISVLLDKQTEVEALAKKSLSGAAAGSSTSPASQAEPVGAAK